jgi:hypothetical protein
MSSKFRLLVTASNRAPFRFPNIPDGLQESGPVKLKGSDDAISGNYDRPMREDLSRLGFEERKTPEAVDEAVKSTAGR